MKTFHPELRREKAEVVGTDAGSIVGFGVGKRKRSSLADFIYFQHCMRSLAEGIMLERRGAKIGAKRDAMKSSFWRVEELGK